MGREPGKIPGRWGWRQVGFHGGEKESSEGPGETCWVVSEGLGGVVVDEGWDWGAKWRRGLEREGAWEELW